MISFPTFVLVRACVAVISLLAVAYAIVCASPFAFDMFIRPQLFPWIGRFVSWHHIWYLLALLGGAITLAPELDPRTPRVGLRRAAHWSAVAYVALGAVVGIWLVQSPYLATLESNGRSLVTAAAACLPLLGLAAIDHLAAWPARSPGHAPAPGRLLLACLACGVYVWVVHVLRAVLLHGGGPVIGWLVTSAWTLTLALTVFTIVLAALTLIHGLAATGPASRRWAFAYALTLAAAVIVTGEFLRRLIFPAIALEGAGSGVVAFVTGATLVLFWSGLALRKPQPEEAPVPAPIEVLSGSVSGTRWPILALLILPLAVSWMLLLAEPVDWMLVMQRVLVAIEWVAAFALIFGLTRLAGERPVPNWILPVLAMLAVAGLWGIPRAAAAAARWSGASQIQHALSGERYAAGDPAFKLMASAVVQWPGHDSTYYRYLQKHGPYSISVQIPDVSLTTRFAKSSGRPPDVFIFAIDSLRRDYLSPYNPAVSFTPHIDSFAKESFVFRNAFTRHGGTALAIPSMWSGGFMVRRDMAFKRMNALEKLIEAEAYRVAINDYTVADLLQTRTTFINPGIPSIRTDLCDNVKGLQEYLEETAADPKPVFGYFAPMNVHLINTWRGGFPADADGDYPGFFPPYATRLRRIDACFGKFISYLKAKRRYDDAVIILTSDHGDSLGEGQRWGHAYWLFPEDIRVPLIIGLPARLAADRTTDLERVAFPTDIAPTLYALLGHPMRDLGPLFGSPLFVESGRDLTPRRRESFLIMSSYAATYAMLRRNGRGLYITDLFERREFAFDLRQEPIGRAVTIDHDIRRLNQRLIREKVEEVVRFYQVRPAF